MKQQNKIIQYMLEHKKISVQEAAGVLHINSPRKVLSKMRSKGWIDDEWIKYYDEEEKRTKHYKVYSLSQGYYDAIRTLQAGN